MSAKVKIPSVQIPTLRASTAIVGTSLFSKPTESSSQHSRQATPWIDESNTVYIEDLVSGVAKCQDAAKQASESLRRQRESQQQYAPFSPGNAFSQPPKTAQRGAAALRTRSPVPVSERKAWGANATTPRERSASSLQTQQQQQHGSNPTTEGKPQRASTPTPLGMASKTVATVVKTPPSGERAAKATSTGMATPPTASRSQKQQQQMLAERELVNALAHQVKILEATVEHERERADGCMRRTQELETKVAAMQSAIELEATQTKEKMLQLTAQVKYTLEWIMRFDTVVGRGSSNVAVDDDDDDREAGRRVECNAVTSAVAEMPRATGSTAASLSPATNPAAATAAGGAPLKSVARRLDMSSESSRSVSRVPPSPPMVLHHQ